MGGELTVGDYVTLQRGTTYKGQLVGKPGPALLGLGSIIPGGGFREGDYKTYGGDCPPKLMLCPGDIFASLKGATKDGKMIGSVARVPRSVPSGRLTQDTVKLEFKGANKEVSDYLYWVLRTPQYRDYCDRHATGSAVVALSREAFLNYPVPPITSIRKKIVSILEFIESKIELNRQINQTLEQIAQTIFKSWFVDFEPVKAKIEAKAAGRDPERAAICAISGKLEPELDQLSPEQYQQLAATAALFPDELVESKLGLIPKGWEVGTVDEEFDLTMGQSPPGNTYNESQEGLPFYQGRTDFGFRFPTHRVFCTAPTRFADVGDTLVSVRAPVGDINMAAERCCIGRGVAATRHKSRSRSYTYYFMRSIHEVFNRFEAEGTVFGSISKKDFHNIQCVKSSVKIVNEFERLISPVDEMVASNEKSTRTLATLRDTLLPKLLSGEIVVNDVVNGD